MDLYDGELFIIQQGS